MAEKYIRKLITVFAVAIFTCWILALMDIYFFECNYAENHRNDFVYFGNRSIRNHAVFIFLASIIFFRILSINSLKVTKIEMIAVLLLLLVCCGTVIYLNRYDPILEDSLRMIYSQYKLEILFFLVLLFYSLISYFRLKLDDL